MLCGAALLASACQQQSGPETADPMSTPSLRPATSTTEASASSAEPTTARTVFDRQDMQTSVLRMLADVYHIDGIQEVSCPPGREVVDGATFQCTVMINGAEKQVTITVRGTDGEYVVSRPE